MKCFILLLLTIPAMPLRSTAADWEKLPPLPEPNGGFVCGAVGGKVIIAGGTNWRDETKHWLDRIRLFDPEAKAWREAGRLAAPVAYAATGSAGDRLWFAGGSSGARTSSKLVMIGADLSMKEVATIEPRIVLASGALLDGALYLIGGTPAQDQLEAATNACYSLDLGTGQATRLADLPAPGFIVGAAAACAGRVFVFGGSRWDAAAGDVSNMTGAFAWSPSERRWSRLPDYPHANRGLGAVALDGRHIYLAGGYKNDADGFTDEAFLFDTTAETYRPATPLPIRAMVALVVAGDFLYCLGGEDRKKSRTDAAFRIRTAELLR